jgi:hypothetical protein
MPGTTSDVRIHIHEMNKLLYCCLTSPIEWHGQYDIGPSPLFFLLASVQISDNLDDTKEPWVIFMAFSSCPILHLMCFDKHILSSLSEFSPPHSPDNDVQASWNRPWKWPSSPRLHSRGTAASSVSLIARWVVYVVTCISCDCCL